jgi:hypothetical protein
LRPAEGAVLVGEVVVLAVVIDGVLVVETESWRCGEMRVG